MKSLFFILLPVLFPLFAIAQEKNFIDQPYIETTVSVDTSVTPDKIYISIILSEDDSRNKKSTEEQEQLLIQTLKELKIDVDRDLGILDYSSNFKSYFLKGKSIIKIKTYSLLVTTASLASDVMTKLEEVGISNALIEKTEYSQADALLSQLRVKAMKKARSLSDEMAKAISQEIGKAIFISDAPNTNENLLGRVAGVQIRGMSSLYGARAAEPVLIEFQKLEFTVKLTTRFTIQ